jgi:type I restriction enzyme S subunit
VSVPGYHSYRESVVDWSAMVPTHWTDTRLRFVAGFNPSKSEVAARDRNEEVSFIPMDAVGDDGTIRLDQTREVGDVETGYTYFADGDVTFAKITPCFENGKGAVMRGLKGGIGFGTTELTVARPTAGNSAEFLYWLFTSPPFRKLGEGSMYGAGGQKRVPDDFARDFRLALPSVAEQAAIAAFLDRETGKIDALVEAQRRLIELLKEKRQAVISHAVTKGLDPTAPMKDSGVEWLGEVPAHWEFLALSRLVDDRRPVTYGIVQPGPSDPEGRFMVRGQDYSTTWADPAAIFRVSAAVEEPYRRARLRVGDIVMTIVGAGVGNVAVVPTFLDGANITQTTARIAAETKLVDPSYLELCLRSDLGRTQVRLFQKGAAQPGLNLEHLKAFRVTLPPPAEQRAILSNVEAKLRGLDPLIEMAEKAMVLLGERRSALISAAVTGKIDVRGLVPEQAEAA